MLDNLRELAEQWETEAQKCDGITDGHVMRRLAKRVCAIELKAALADMERERQRSDKLFATLDDLRRDLRGES